jgi:hypothetical protein
MAIIRANIIQRASMAWLEEKIIQFFWVVRVQTH